MVTPEQNARLDRAITEGRKAAHRFLIEAEDTENPEEITNHLMILHVAALHVLARLIFAQYSELGIPIQKGLDEFLRELRGECDFVMSVMGKLDS